MWASEVSICDYSPLTSLALCGSKGFNHETATMRTESHEAPRLSIKFCIFWFSPSFSFTTINQKKMEDEGRWRKQFQDTIDSLNESQRNSVLSKAKTLQILAGPGSGKTRGKKRFISCFWACTNHIIPKSVDLQSSPLCSQWKDQASANHCSNIYQQGSERNEKAFVYHDWKQEHRQLGYWHFSCHLCSSCAF